MEGHMSIESLCHLWNRAKPFLAVIFLQFGNAGMAIIAKVALNQGMSHYTLVVYRHAIATAVIAPFAIIFERKVRPKMTFSIFAKIMLLGLLEPVIDQNLYYSGMKHTSATFTSTMSNILPALTFMMACILRLEKLNMKNVHSQAKVVGTIVTVGGAIVMTLVKGPIIEMLWMKGRSNHGHKNDTNHQDPIKGSLRIIAGCFCWACFIILQAITLKTYPAELSLAAWICMMGTMGGTVVAVAAEWGNAAVWSIHWDAKLLAALYGGIICSGIGYYVQGVIMKKKGPVFVTAFSPLSMVIVSVLGSSILAEQMFLGRVIGAVVIVAGLYLVVWGKSKDHIHSSKSINEQIVPVELPIDDMKANYDHEFIPIDVTTTQMISTDNPIELPINAIDDMKANPDHEFVSIGVATPQVVSTDDCK